MDERDERVCSRVRNARRLLGDDLSPRDECTGSVWVQPNLGIVVFQNVTVGSLLQLFLDSRPFNGLAGLLDPIERDCFDRDGVHDAESTKPYDYSVECGIVLNESDVRKGFLGISYSVGRSSP